MALLALEAKAQFQHLTLLFGQVRQPAAELLLMDAALHLIEGFAVGLIGNQLAEETAALFAIDRGIQAGGGEGLAQQRVELIEGHVHLFRNLLAAGHGAEFVGELEADLADRGQALGEMDRQADRAGLAGDGPGHALADPPEGIGGELVAAGRVKFLDRALEAEGPLLDQIEELEAFALVFLGNADDEAQVGLHHPLFGALAHTHDLLFMRCIGVAFVFFGKPHHGLHLIAQFNLFGGRQQRNPANGREVPTNRIATAATTSAVGVGAGGGCHGLLLKRGKNLLRVFLKPLGFQ